MRPTKSTAVTLDQSSVTGKNYSIGLGTHIALLKGRTLSRVYPMGLTNASGALVRSEADTGPEDPRLVA